MNASTTLALALPALLCGLGASLHAQTASFSGITTAFDTTHFVSAEGITTDARGDLFIAATPDHTTWNIYEMQRTGPGAYTAPVALPGPTGGYGCAGISYCLRNVAVDPSGNVWVAAWGTGKVYKVPYNSGTNSYTANASLVAGPSPSGWSKPWGIAADASGNIFVADETANSIAKITGGSATWINTTSVRQPGGIVVDSSGNLLVLDGNVARVVKLTASSSYTSASNVGSANFGGPGNLAVDALGNIWVTNYNANLICEMTIASNFATVLNFGTGLQTPVELWPTFEGTILVSDEDHGVIRQIAPVVNLGTVAVGATSAKQTLSFTFTGTSSTTIQAPVIVTQGATGLDFTDAGTGTCTTTNGTGHPYASNATCTVDVTLKPKYAGTRDGAVKLLNTSGTVLATAYLYGTGAGPQLAFTGGTYQGVYWTQSILSPEGVAVDGTGKVYFDVHLGSGVTAIPPGCITDTCRVGLGGGLSQPRAIAVDGAGNVYVADYGSNAVKQIPPGCASSSCVATLGGGFNQPQGVAVDRGGNVFVADSANNAVKKMPAGCSSSSCVTTLAGAFNQPQGVAVDGTGNVYVADTSNSAVKEIPLGCASSSCVTTLGGGFSAPDGVAVDGIGDVYVVDNHTATVMPPGCSSSGCVTTVRQSPGEVYTGVAVDGSGSVYLSDTLGPGVYGLQLALPPSLSFANTHAGSQSSDSPKSVTLRNIGNAPLTFPVPGTGTNPSVSANFKVDSSTTCPEILTSSSAGSLAGAASCELALDFLPATTGQISGAAVLTDNNLNASPSTTQSIALSGTGTSLVPTPTVTATPSSSSITTTDSVSVTVTLTGGSGNPVPKGSVSLSGPGLSVSPLALSGGSATFNISSNTLSLGTDTLTASYSGDSNYGTATGSTTVTVTKAMPTVSASADPATITTLQSTVVTVSVSGSTQPTGTITLSNTGITVGSGTLTAGTAQITVSGSALALGTDTLTATYSGDGVYSTATGSTTVTVSKATPTVSASADPATITTLQSTVVTVSVSGSTQPTGTITLSSTGITVGSGTLTAGTTQITVSGGALALGTNALTATYSGDSNYDTAIGSTSVTVIKATPTVSVSADPATITTLGSTVVTVSVGGAQQPTGTITLTSGGVAAGSGTLAGGTAQITVSGAALPLGTDMLTATYSGDSNYDTATGSTSVTVTKTIPGVSVSATPASITTLQSAVVTVSVTGPQQPTGTITVSSGEITLGSDSLAGGTASITVSGSALPLGANTLTISYSGDIVLSPATTTTTVTVATPVYPDNTFGAVSLGSTSSSPITITFNAISTLGSTAVLTQGAQGLDFTNAGTGSCDTSPGHTYGVGETCTVNVTFAPRYAGARYGAVNVLSPSGNVVATAYMYGTGLGPELVFPSNAAVQTLGGGFDGVSGLAVDASGNVYVADGDSVKKIPPGCTSSSCAVTLISGLHPWRVAVDGGGNIYITDDVNQALQEIPAGCATSSCVTTLGGGFSGPNYVAVDGSGNVYVTDVDHTQGAGWLKKVPPGCVSSSCVVTFPGDLSNPAGVAVDGSGDIYVADTGNLSIDEIRTRNCATNCSTTLDSYAGPDIAVDGSGNVYPGYAAVDGSGNLYRVNNNAVQEFPLAIPPNLVFANTNVGSQSSDSPQTIALRNIGTAPLTFPVPASGQNPLVSANFTLGGSTTCPRITTSSSAGTLGAGASCSLAVNFIPTMSGQITGSVDLTDDSLNVANSRQSIGLSGAGGTPILPYIRVNLGAWQQVSSVTVSAGDRVDLGPQPATGGSWSWSGPNSLSSNSRTIYSVPLTTGTNTYTATYTNTGGVHSTLDFTITVNTPIVPYIRVNLGVWQQVSSVTVNTGDRVDFGPQPSSGGSWSWGGPNSFSSTSRTVYSVPLTAGTNTYTATYSNTAGAHSTQDFIITVNTPIVPYIRVNSGAWQQVSSVTVNTGDRVDFGPQPASGGSWSWSGPSSFSSNSRTVYSVPLTGGTDVFTATYTNAGGGHSTLAFTITVNTPIVPYIRVNLGAWQQASSVTVNTGDRVDFGPQPATGGSWSWGGPSGFSSSSRTVYSVPLTAGTDVFTATYNNAGGGHSTLDFTITVNTPIVPYIRVNLGAWQQTASVTVNAGDRVDFGPQPASGGSWSWNGPSGFSSSSRTVYSVPLTAGTNTYTATYANAAGAHSSQDLIITVN